MGVAVACSVPRYEDFARDPQPVGIPTGPYYDLAALDSGRVALAVAADNSRESRIDIVDVATGRVEAIVPLVERPGCVVRLVRGLTHLPDARLGFADECETRGGLSTLTVGLHAYDLTDGAISDMGALADGPGEMAWTRDMSRLTYGAGTTLCLTIYVRADGTDGPLAVSVVAQGREMLLGEDVVNARDRCTQQGNATSPTLNPATEQLAVLVSSTGGVGGQGRLDLPWGVALVTGDSAVVVFDGIVHPGGLAWVTDEDLVFSGEVGGQEGIWLIDAQGGDLRRVTNVALAPFSLVPGETALIGLAALHGMPDDPPVPMDILRVDLADPVH